MSKRRIHSGKIIVKIRIQKFAHCTSLGKGNENGLKNMFLKPQQNNSNIEAKHVLDQINNLNIAPVA